MLHLCVITYMVYVEDEAAAIATVEACSVVERLYIHKLDRISNVGRVALGGFPL